MKKWGYAWRVVLWIVVAVLVASCALQVPGQQGQQPPPQGQGQGTPGQGQGQPPAGRARQGGGAGAPRAVPVEVATAITGTVSQIFGYAGTLQAKDTVRVTPLVSGRIASVPVKVGDVLKAGDPIAEIDQTVLQAQVAQAQAAYQAAALKLTRMQIGSRPEEIAAAEAAVVAAQAAIASTEAPTNDQRTVAAANMLKAQAALQQAQHDYDKISYDSSASSSPQALALQQATLTYQSALADYNLTIKPTDGQLAPLQNNLAQAQLKLALTKQPYLDSDLGQAQAAADQAKAALDMAKTQLGFATIRAPFDGAVAEIYISPGTTVGPTGPVALFVANRDEVLVDIQESQIGQIKNGENAALTVSAYPGQTFPAMITAVAPVADAKTHTFQVEVTPADPGNLLRPGMYADVSILASEKQNAVLVPQKAIVTDSNDKPTVFVVNNNTAELRPVTTGLTDKDNIEIVSGLKAGDTVVTAGQSNLSSGARVQVASSGTSGANGANGASGGRGANGANGANGASGGRGARGTSSGGNGSGSGTSGTSGGRGTSGAGGG